MLQNNTRLKSLIVGLWDTFWSGGIANPITAIEQITYLLFIKRLDELESKREKEAKTNKKKYISKFSGNYNPYVDTSKFKLGKGQGGTFWFEEQAQLDQALIAARSPRPKSELRWSVFKEIQDTDKLLEHVRYNVFDFLKGLNDDVSPFTKYMENAYLSIEKPSLLVEAIAKIDEIFLEIERDAKESGYAFQDIQGDVYEMLLKETSQGGKNGQFRTPRHIITLMTELIEPKLGERIADPACGTSGFLLGAYQYILTDLARKDIHTKLIKDDDGFERNTNSSSLNEKMRQQLNQSLFGFDIDTTMIRLGLMNLIMHGIDNPQINYKDTLSKSYNETAEYDIVLANPPFTGKLDKKDVNVDLKIDSGSTELLFLLRISKMLKNNGRAAVIIPEGVLFGGSKAQKATREILLKDNQIQAVISLPSGVFKPYTGVKTSILLFTKVVEKSTEWNTEKVWFYSLDNDGYSLDDNRRKLKENPLPDVKATFDTRNEMTHSDRKKHFFVSLEEIKQNNLDLSYNRYKEYIYTEEKYEPPLDILERLILLENEILSDMNDLKKLLL